MGLGVWGLSFGVWGLVFGVRNLALEFRAWGLGAVVRGLGLVAWGLGFGVRCWVDSPGSSDGAYHQIIDKKYLDCFNIHEIPCGVQAEPLLCKVNGYSESVKIVHLVWLVCEKNG